MASRLALAGRELVNTRPKLAILEQGVDVLYNLGCMLLLDQPHDILVDGLVELGSQLSSGSVVVGLASQVITVLLLHELGKVRDELGHNELLLLERAVFYHLLENPAAIVLEDEGAKVLDHTKSLGD